MTVIADHTGPRQTAPGPLHNLVMPSEGYVFVMTYARSGDLLLQTILNTLPGYCIRGENTNALEDMVRAFSRLDDQPSRSGPEAEMARNLLGWRMADSFARNVLAPSPGMRVSGFRESALPTDAGRFWAMMDFLHAFFPNARFLFNTRNRKRVIRLGRWAKRPEAEALAEIAQLESLFRAYAQARAHCCFHVHYDDYVAAPDRLEPLFDFLEEPFSPDRVAAIIKGGEQ